MSKYASWIEGARYAGVSEADITAQVEEFEHVDSHLDRGLCPKCKTKIVGEVDGDQSGPSKVAGVWVNYRCKCGYALDRKEER